MASRKRLTLPGTGAVIIHRLDIILACLAGEETITDVGRRQKISFNAASTAVSRRMHTLPFSALVSSALCYFAWFRLHIQLNACARLA